MYNSPLLPGVYYHLYNHAVGDENLFRRHKNYLFFLEKYTRHIHPVAHTYAYCLMPNYFHLLVRIRTEEEIAAYHCELKRKAALPSNEFDYFTFVMQQFSNLCNSYAKAFNLRFDRRGALFIDYSAENRWRVRYTSRPCWPIFTGIRYIMNSAATLLIGPTRRCIQSSAASQPAWSETPYWTGLEELRRMFSFIGRTRLFRREKTGNSVDNKPVRTEKDLIG